LKELGKLKDSYDFSFDARKLGLVLLGAFSVAALVFVLGVSVGIQWERKKSEGMQKSAVLAVPPKPAMASQKFPAPAGIQTGNCRAAASGSPACLADGA
jgi:hypothetical protein